MGTRQPKASILRENEHLVCCLIGAAFDLKERQSYAIINSHGTPAVVWE